MADRARTRFGSTSFPSRDVIVSAVTDVSGNVSASGVRAHLLFTRSVEKKRLAASAQTSTGALIYNGGSVMTGSPTIYLVFYQPPGTAPFPAGYASGIEAFFNHASASSFASIWTQYTDSAGAGPDGTFTVGKPGDPTGGVYIDEATVPPSGNAGTQASPLTDSDIRHEVAAAYAANPTWQAPGAGALYEVFLSPNTFEELGAGEVSFEQFCAYHADAVGADGFYAYTLIPYAASSGSCSSNVAPNNIPVDGSSNLAWHETSESITDPYFEGYISSDGDEVADLCSSEFFPIAPNAANSQMNGRLVLLQELWSNAVNACDKRLGSPAGSILNLVLPASVDFGSVTRGTASTQTLVVQNNTPPDEGWAGNEANLYYVAMGSGSNAAFSVASPGGMAVAAGGTLNLPIQLAKSTSLGTLQGTVDIWTDDTSQAQPETVAVSANVVASTPSPAATPTPAPSASASSTPSATPSVTPSATPSPNGTPSPSPSASSSATPTPIPTKSAELQLNPGQAINFKKVRLGKSATRALHVKAVYQGQGHAPPGLALHGLTLQVTNAAPGGFALQRTSCGTTLTAGKNCQVWLTFTPNGAGVTTGTFRVTTADSIKAPSVNLTGTGEAPKPHK